MDHGEDSDPFAAHSLSAPCRMLVLGRIDELACIEDAPPVVAVFHTVTMQLNDRALRSPGD